MVKQIVKQNKQTNEIIWLLLFLMFNFLIMPILLIWSATW